VIEDRRLLLKYSLETEVSTIVKGCLDREFLEKLLSLGKLILGPDLCLASFISLPV
jgi:hypothetical protein